TGKRWRGGVARCLVAVNNEGSGAMQVGAALRHAGSSVHQVALVALLVVAALVGERWRPAAATGAHLVASPPPEVIGQVGGSWGPVVMQGTLLYAWLGPRLAVLDVSDPAQPA